MTISASAMVDNNHMEVVFRDGRIESLDPDVEWDTFNFEDDRVFISIIETANNNYSFVFYNPESKLKTVEIRIILSTEKSSREYIFVGRNLRSPQFNWLRVFG